MKSSLVETLTIEMEEDKKTSTGFKTVCSVIYTARLGLIPGRPDLPHFTLAMLQIILKAYHRDWHNGFTVNEVNSEIHVALHYHPNIKNIRENCLKGAVSMVSVSILY